MSKPVRTVGLGLLLLACTSQDPAAESAGSGGSSGSTGSSTGAGGTTGGNGGTSAGSAGTTSGGTAGGGGSAGTGGGGAGGGGSVGAGGVSGGASGSGGSSGGSAGGGSGGSTVTGELPATIWIAGDSTVATSGGTPCPVGWGGQFDALFNDNISVVNSAVGGRSVRTWLYDVTDQFGGDTECVRNLDQGGNPTLQQRWQDMLEGMKAGDYLFIQFGINDGSATCPRHVGLDAFKAEYGMMAQAARERGAQPVFLTPVSAIACSGSTAQGTRGSFVTATLDAGETYDVPVIDLHALSVALYQSLSFCPVPGGDVSAGTTGPVGEFFCDDHTHFAQSGAVEIAKLVAGALADAGVSLSAYLK